MGESVLVKLKRARRVSVPLLAINSADMGATERAIAGELNGSAPIIGWDLVRGFRALNELGLSVLNECMGGGDPSEVNNPVDALVKFAGFPGCEREGSKIVRGGSILLLHSAHLWLSDSLAARQALLNLRDSLKADNRLVILLSPQLFLPIELQQSVEVFDEPLPDDERVKSIVAEVVESSGLTVQPSVIDEAAGALRGLSQFSVDQCAAMALSRTALDVGACWDRKESQVGQTRGLKMFRSSVRFGDLGGLESFKSFMRSLGAGPKRPRVVVWVDEIEKALAGSSGDNTGVSQDFVGTILTTMEAEKWTGSVLLGPPGSGKTAISLATAGEMGVPVVQLDLGGMKSSGVGDSESAIRRAMSIIKSCGGADVLMLATCNRIQTLPPEIRRRFRLGTWFCDLPDAAERAKIWEITLRAYGLGSQALPKDEGWSGANIRDCADIAYSTGVSVLEAAKYIVSAWEQDSQGITELRRLAAGRYLSASYAGAYRSGSPAAVQSTARVIGGE